MFLFFEEKNKLAATGGVTPGIPSTRHCRTLALGIRVLHRLERSPERQRSVLFAECRLPVFADASLPLVFPSHSCPQLTTVHVRSGSIGETAGSSPCAAHSPNPKVHRTHRTENIMARVTECCR